MNKKLLMAGVALLAVFGLGYYIGHIGKPSTVTKETEEVKKDIRTIVKEIKRPDGTVETVTETTDKTKESASKNLTIIPEPKRNVDVSITAVVDKSLKPVYGVLVQKPLLFPRLIVGLGINTDLQAVLTAGWSF